VTTAIGASTVQSLSGGRYAITLGATPREWSERWHGIPYANPLERMRDYVAAMRAAWASAPARPASHAGPFYRFDGYEHALHDWAPVPLLIAATRPGMCRLAGEIADGTVLNLMLTPGGLADVALPAIAAGLDASGRARGAFDMGLLRMAAIDDDPSRARDLVRPGLGFYFAVPYLRDVLEHEGLHEELERGSAAAVRHDPVGMAAAVSDRMVDAMALAGTAADVQAAVARYAGLVDWIEVMPPIGSPGDLTLQQTERIIDTLASIPILGRRAGQTSAEGG
jgi:alkanesulfonate monooxygenase SsuD/methylene tetrahydromethanopterin reductase-like flavin-dependent oxidoreductase (luciferase family)